MSGNDDDRLVFLMHPEREQNSADIAADAGETVVLNLLNPKTKQKANFMFANKQLLEIQKAKQQTPKSWFIDQRVQKDGILYLASLYDPLFIMLSLLTTEMETKKQIKFIPLSQLFQVANLPHYRYILKCKDFKYQFLCEVNDQYGDDMILVKINESKVLNWLKLKVKAIKTFLYTASEATLNNRVAGCAESFNMTQSDNKAPSKVDLQLYEKKVLNQALQILNDYIPEYWMNKLILNYSTTLANVLSQNKKSKNADNTKPEKRSWEEANGYKVDEHSKFTNPVVAAASNVVQQKATKKKKVMKKSLAQRKLDKVDTSKMKSLNSFFSKKVVPKKKKL